MWFLVGVLFVSFWFLVGVRGALAGQSGTELGCRPDSVPELRARARSRMVTFPRSSNGTEWDRVGPQVRQQVHQQVPARTPASFQQPAANTNKTCKTCTNSCKTELPLSCLAAAPQLPQQVVCGCCPSAAPQLPLSCPNKWSAAAASFASRLGLRLCLFRNTSKTTFPDLLTGSAPPSLLNLCAAGPRPTRTATPLSSTSALPHDRPRSSTSAFSEILVRLLFRTALAHQDALLDAATSPSEPRATKPRHCA